VYASTTCTDLIERSAAPKPPGLFGTFGARR